MNTLPKKLIYWDDAALFSPERAVIAVTKMQTCGYLEKETEEFVIIRKPITTRVENGTEHPKKTPTFYFIPKGMITSIETLK